jgi:hypothetical protein
LLPHLLKQNHPQLPHERQLPPPDHQVPPQRNPNPSESPTEELHCQPYEFGAKSHLIRLVLILTAQEPTQLEVSVCVLGGYVLGVGKACLTLFVSSLLSFLLLFSFIGNFLRISFKVYLMKIQVKFNHLDLIKFELKGGLIP